MKKILKLSFEISIKNWTTLLLFEILFKSAVSSFLFYTLTHELTALLLKAAGTSYISFENISLLFTNPTALLLLLCLVLALALCSFFETSALYLYCENGWSHKTISLWQLVKAALVSCSRMFHGKNILFFLGFLLTTQLTFLPFSHYLLGWGRMPDLILDFIKSRPLLFTAVFLTVNYAFFLYLFAMVPAILGSRDFKTSWSGALLLLKQKKLKTIAGLLLSIAVFLLFFFGAASLAVLCLAAYTKLLYLPGEAASAFRFFYKAWSPAVLFAAGTSGTIWLFSSVISLFHSCRGDVRPLPPPKSSGRFRFLRQAFLAVCAVIMLLLFSETEAGGYFIYPDNLSTKIIAHRAGAKTAPENTASALKHAIAAQADEAEIDVRQLKDKTLVVMHDSNFKRTAGVDLAVWETDWGQVKTFDAGSWFSEDFASEPVPLLEDMMKQAKNRINLMIELKLAGHEQAMEQDVLDLIRRYDMVHQCSIASMNLDILKRVKDMEPRIETVYISPLLILNSPAFNYVDSYSVETGSISREMANSIQLQGKRLYGWTANSEAAIDKNIRCRVNGIITDNPELAGRRVEQAGENRLLNFLVSLFFSR